LIFKKKISRKPSEKMKMNSKTIPQRKKKLMYGKLLGRLKKLLKLVQKHPPLHFSSLALVKY